MRTVLGGRTCVCKNTQYPAKTMDGRKERRDLLCVEERKAADGGVQLTGRFECVAMTMTEFEELALEMRAAREIGYAVSHVES